MKTTCTALASLLLGPLAAPQAADNSGQTKLAPPPDSAPITDDPKLPLVLPMGDSVSIADVLEVRKPLVGAAN